MRWIMLLTLTGCAENWVAWDRLEEPMSGPGEVVVRMTTRPEAWPAVLYGGALRACTSPVDRRPDEGSALSLLESGYELYEPGPGCLNVMDAWAGCDPDTVCVEEFTFRCDGDCRRAFSADAFLSTQRLFAPDHQEAVRLEIVEVVPDEPEDDDLEIAW